MRYAIFLLLLAIIGCTRGPNKKEGKVDEKPLVKRIELEGINGKKISLEELKGKVVFLNFWATWCKPCVKEMPSIDKAREILKDEPIVFIVASDEDMEKIKSYIPKLPYQFQFAHSLTSVFDLDIKALPTTMIINKEGEIVFNEIGGRDWSTSINITLIKKIIDTPN